uniref:Uncharacterized protein n=1 Tax=Theileria annulata TaxID=5874 RepID=A0A3B0MU20_THEAN
MQFIILLYLLISLWALRGCESADRFSEFFKKYRATKQIDSSDEEVEQGASKDRRKYKGSRDKKTDQGEKCEKEDKGDKAGAGDSEKPDKVVVVGGPGLVKPIYLSEPSGKVNEPEIIKVTLLDSEDEEEERKRQEEEKRKNAYLIYTNEELQATQLGIGVNFHDLEPKYECFQS